MKKIISLFTTLCIAFSMLGTLTVFAQDSAADMKISTLAELEAFRDDVNSGNTYEGKTVVLGNDIDLSQICGEDINGETVSWTPIGMENMFEGTFNGNGHTISGLYINSESIGWAGLFGGCGENSQIMNLTVDGSVKAGYPDDGVWANPPVYLGGIAGISVGKIANCHNKAMITGVGNGAYAAGICGIGASVENCINTGRIVSDSTSEAIIASGSVDNCKNCYYLTDTSVDGSGAQAKTAEQFKSGEVAYLLGDKWGQKIGVDKHPVIGGDKVYFANNTYTNTKPKYPYEITGLRLTDTSGNEIMLPEQGKSFIVETDIVKTEERDEKDYLFVAVYDENGVLLNLDYVKAKFTVDGECSFGFNIPAQTKKVGSVKAFVWNTFNSMEPLAQSQILAPVVFE